MAEAQSIIDQRPEFNPATSTRRFRIMMSDYVASVLMAHALPIIQREAPSVGIDILPFEETPPEEVIDRVEVDMVVLPQQFLPPEHPSEELFRDMYTCIVWKGNREIGKTLTLDEYLSRPHVAMRFTTQPADSLSEWILHRTGRRRRVDVTARTYTVIPHLVINTTRIATVHRHQANLYAKFLPIRIVDPSFEMPLVAERIQWHSFRNPDPGIAWLRKCMHEAAQNLTTGVGGN
jgi:DNA-binding transcriptional LysR family regulator